MKIKVLDEENLEELSMIEVAHALLDQKGTEMSFSDIVSSIQTYLKKSDEQIKSVLSRFYTDLNTDGSFIPLGNNTWGLRSWYAIGSIDEETISFDYFDDDGKLKKDESLEEVSDITNEIEDESEEKLEKETNYDEDEEDSNETKAYDEELAEVEVDAEIPENVVKFMDEDDDDDDDSEEEEK
ncbi:MAG: DNA-directed RNA polymerase subunit delta [Lactovum sp.]